MKKFVSRVSGSLAALMVVQLVSPAMPLFAAPTPSYTMAENITSTSADIRVGTSEAAYTRIEYGTTAAQYTMYYPASSSATTGSTSSYINSTPWYTHYTLTGLTPSMTYYYRVGVCGMTNPTNCINSAATSYTYGAQTSFTTGAPTDTFPPAQVTGLAISQITKDSLVLSFTAPMDPGINGSTGPAARYEIKYKQSGTFAEADWTSGAMMFSGAPTPASSGTTQAVTVTGLTPLTSYTFAIKAFDANNNTSPLSSPITGTTAAAPVVDSTAPDRVAGITTTGTSGGVQLQWTAPSDIRADGTRGDVTKYEIKYNTFSGTDEATWWTAAQTFSGVPTPVAYGTTQTVLVTGLTPGTVYYFSLKAFDGTGNASQFSVPVAGAVHTTVQTPGTSSNTFPPGNAWLEVQVTAPATTQRPAGPVVGAVIGLSSNSACTPQGGNGSASGLSNSSGKWNFAGSTEGYYKLGVGAPSDRTDLMGMDWGCIKLTNNATNLASVTLPLVTGQTQTTGGSASLRVYVKDQNGTNLSGATVELTFCGPTSTSPCNVMNLPPQTGTGEYYLAGLAGNTNGAGSYNLKVTPPSSRQDLDFSQMNLGVLEANSPRIQWITLMPKTGQKGGVASLTGVYSQVSTPDSASVYFSIDKPASVMVEYTTSPTGASWSVGPSLTVGVGDSYSGRSIMLTGLMPSTTYYYRVTATNSSGSASWPFGGTAQPASSFQTMMRSGPMTGTASLTIMVLDPSGKPLPGAQLGLNSCVTMTSTFAGSPPYQGTPCPWYNGTTALTKIGDIPQAAYTFTNLPVGSYTLGISAPQDRLQEIEHVSDYPVVIAAGEAKTLPPITLKAKTAISGDQLFLRDVRSTIFDNGTSAWISWQTDIPSTSHVDFGPTPSFSMAADDPAFTTNHSVRLYNLASNMTYHFQARSYDSQGRVGKSTTYAFSTGGQTGMPFNVDSSKSFPYQGATNVPLPLESLHLEFTRPLDQTSITPSAMKLATSAQVSIPFTLTPMPAGFNLVLTESLKPNTTYTLTILRGGGIKDTMGASLGYDYYHTFTTGSTTASRGDGIFKGSVKLLNGTPIKDADVTLYAPSATYKDHRMTNESGEFYFTALPLDQTFMVDIFPPASFGSYKKPQPFEVRLTSAARAAAQDIILLPNTQYMIEGRVTFENGTPVTDAEVTVVRTDSPQWVPSVSVNGEGKYQIYAQPGTWSVSVHPRMDYPMPPMPYTMGGGPMGNGPMPYGGPYGMQQYAQSPSTMQMPYQQQSPYSTPSMMSMPYPPRMPSWMPPSPQQVKISENTPSASADFVIAKSNAQTATVFGSVSRADGDSFVPGTTRVKLRSQNMSGSSGFAEFSGTTGTFSFTVSSGWYELIVETSDPDLLIPPPMKFQLGRDEQKNLGSIILANTSSREGTGMITGRITKGGEPASGIKVLAMRSGGFGGERSSALTDEKGIFTMKVSYGEWMVFPSDSTASQPIPLAKPQPTTVTPKGQGSTLSFNLLENDSTVIGTLKTSDGAEATDVWGHVSVQPEKANQAMYHQGFGAPVERGTFKLTLPAGSYLLMFTPLPNSKYVAAQPSGMPLTVERGATQNVTLLVKNQDEVQKASIAGSLVDKNGQKITGIPFTVYAARGAEWQSTEGDAATGSYTLSLSPGVWSIGYDLKGESLGYERSSTRVRSVTLRPNATRTLNLQVTKRGGMILGIAQMSNEDPIPGVLVILSEKPFASIFKKDESVDVYQVHTDDTGSFEFSVPQGTYYLRALLPESANLSGPSERKVQTQNQENADLTAETTLTFKAVSATLSGRTTIAGLPTWARVWAWSDQGGYVQSTTDNDGTYSFQVSPGSWHVSAMSHINGEVYRASEAVVKIGNSGTSEQNIDLVAFGIRVPEIVSVNGDPSKPLVVDNAVGVKVVLPPNAAGTQGTVNVSIAPEVIAGSQGTDRVLGGMGYEVSVKDERQEDITRLNSNLILYFPYNPRELANLGLTPEQLTPNYWNGTNWQPHDNAVLEAANNRFVISTDHLTKFALLASTKVSPPPAPKAEAMLVGKAVSLTGLAVNKDIDYVKVYRSTKKGTLGNVILNDISAKKISDKTAKKGKKYYYTVRSVDKFGNESTNTKQLEVKL